MEETRKGIREKEMKNRGWTVICSHSEFIGFYVSGFWGICDISASLEENVILFEN